MYEMVENRRIVGKFWVIGSKEDADIIFDRDELDREEGGEPHHVMWKRLVNEQFEGKYSRYDDRYFPRGKVVYDRNLSKTFVYVDKKILDIRDKIDEKLRRIFSLEDYEYCLDEQYQSMMNFDDELNYLIIRGKNIIGGNLIEIYYGKTKILVELGKELGSEEELTEQEEVVINTKYDAVVISHYHADHAGLVGNKKDCKIYMGEGTKRVLNAIDKYKGKEEADNFLTYANCKSFYIGQIMITPYLCDHSAFDSHMLLFEGGGKSILYTGDFRFSGRKSKDRLFRDLPNKVDTLICEGTNICNHEETADNKEERDIICAKTEQELEERAVQIMKSEKMVFILQSSTNIDRIVSFYRASIKTGRMFYMDNYQAQIAEAAGNKIPRPDVFNNVYTFVSSRIRGCRYDYLKSIKQKKRLTQIAQDGKFTMLLRQSMFSCIEKISDSIDLKDSVLIYSLWEGYKEDEKMKAFLDRIERLGIKIVSLHTSGHACPQDIDKLRRRVNPGEFVLVHTEVS